MPSIHGSHGPRDLSAISTDTHVDATDAHASSTTTMTAGPGRTAAPPAADRSAAAGYDPKTAVSFVAGFNKQLGLGADAVKVKTDSMKKDAHAFFRAMPALYYKDLAGPFAAKSQLLNRPSPQVTLSGDMHLQNFGTVKGPNGDAVFGINDFDQSGRGKAEWDLDRLASSAVLAARQAGLSPDEQKTIVAKIAKHYCETIQDAASGKDTSPPFISQNDAKGPVKDMIKAAEQKTRDDQLSKCTTQVNGQYQLKADDLKPLAAGEKKALMDGLAGYERGIGPSPDVARPLKIVDVAEKTDGGGSSYGLKRYAVLVAAADPKKPPRLLEVKQFPPSPISNQSGDLSRADGAAVVANQRALGGLMNPLTGSANIGGKSFLVREDEPKKAKISLDKLSGNDFEDYAKQAATVLARAEARSPAQAGALAGWIGNDQDKLAQHLVDFATTYADQTEADWKAFKTGG